MEGYAARVAPNPNGAVALRERARAAVRREIAAVAMRLFTDRGFESVTVDQIAHEAGISPRSFFRYFATKEDVVLDGVGDAGHRVEAAMAARPADEPAWEALRHALRVLVDPPFGASANALALARMFVETPSLRAREVEKQRRWEALLLPHVRARLGPRQGAPDSPDPRAEALIAAALGCLRAASEAWVRGDGRGEPLAVLDEAMRAVRT